MHPASDCWFGSDLIDVGPLNEMMADGVVLLILLTREGCFISNVETVLRHCDCVCYAGRYFSTFQRCRCRTSELLSHTPHAFRCKPHESR